MVLRSLIFSALINPQRFLSLLIGLEASTWLHLILDGDPLPAEWHRWRHR